MLTPNSLLLFLLVVNRIPVLGFQVAEMMCSNGVLANNQEVQLQCVFNHGTGLGESSAPTLLPTQMNNAVINSSSTSSSMMLAVSSSSVGSARSEQG
jgi:hypothetical protein